MTTEELIQKGMHPAEATSIDRDEAIRLIRTALKKRSGKTWSVTGGRGTAYGWITIQAPPARRVAHDPNPAYDHNAPYDANAPKSTIPAHIEVDSPGRNWYTSEADCAELAELLGLTYAHCQGVTIAASSEYRREYVTRAKGLAVLNVGTPYWD